MTSVLFVCLGNICRSPLAEGVFRHLVEQAEKSKEYIIDSCGTGGWHVGEPPHRESRAVARRNGVSLEGQTARQLDREDFKRFDLIVAMDRQNRRDIERLMPKGSSCRVVCLREFDPEIVELDVPDPYYGGPDGFEEVYRIVERSCEALLDSLVLEKEAER